MPPRRPRKPSLSELADLLAIVWLAMAGLTAGIGILEYEERSGIANLLRVLIVALMVLTAFLLIRYDVRRGGDGE